MRTGLESAVYVVWVEPEDGAQGVFRDPVVLVRVSHPIDPQSLSNFQVRDEGEALPSRQEASPDLRVLICRPLRLLCAGREYAVVLEGVRDRRGQPVAGFRSRFTCGPLAHADVTSAEGLTGNPSLT